MGAHAVRTTASGIGPVGPEASGRLGIGTWVPDARLKLRWASDRHRMSASGYDRVGADRLVRGAREAAEAPSGASGDRPTPSPVGPCVPEGSRCSPTDRVARDCRVDHLPASGSSATCQSVHRLATAGRAAEAQDTARSADRRGVPCESVHGQIVNRRPVSFSHSGCGMTRTPVIGSAPRRGAPRLPAATAVDPPATGQLASRSVSLPQDGIPEPAGPVAGFHERRDLAGRSQPRRAAKTQLTYGVRIAHPACRPNVVGPTPVCWRNPATRDIELLPQRLHASDGADALAIMSMRRR